METHKPLPASHGMPKKSPFFLILAVISLVAVVAFAFYLHLQKTAIEEQKKIIEAEMVSIQAETDALKEQRLEATQIAQQWLDEVEAEEILWSRVITRIDSLLPVDTVTEEPRINVVSYSGGSGGKISLNATTGAAQTEPYEHVAELLAAFNSSTDFMDAVIPAVTKGETEDGQKFLSFSMSFAFNNESGTAIQASGSTEAGGDEAAADDTAKVKVPRQ
jgi:hypothetical protein